MRCPNCNSEIPEESIFCPECGQKIQNGADGPTENDEHTEEGSAEEEQGQDSEDSLWNQQQNFGDSYGNSSQNFGSSYGGRQQNFGGSYGNPSQNFGGSYGNSQQNSGSSYGNPSQGRPGNNGNTYWRQPQRDSQRQQQQQRQNGAYPNGYQSGEQNRQPSGSSERIAAGGGFDPGPQRKKNNNVLIIIIAVIAVLVSVSLATFLALRSRAKEEAAQTVAENDASENLADASDNGEADQGETAPQEPEDEEAVPVPESTATPVPTATPAPTPTPADYPASEITASLVSESSVDFSSLHAAYLKSAYATSEIKQASGVSNDPVLAFDNDTNTNWEEGVDGPGIGESITGEFQYEKEKVKCIALKLGNWKSEKYYYGNNRPSKLTITLDDLSFQIDFPDSWEEFYVMLNHPYKASSIRLTIDGVHAGSSWDDTCITDVRVLVE